MRARVVLEPAYLLRQQPYRDTSQLLEAFTRGHGRIGLVARGARGPKSALRGVLQPFAPLLLSWTVTGELASLQGAEAAGPPLPLHGERIFHGWYVHELLLRLLQRHDAHPALFDTYALTLAQLAHSAEIAEQALRLFERELLAELGYGLSLDEDFDADAHYRYDVERGAQRLAQADAQSYRGSSLIALRDGHLPDVLARRDAKRLLRAALAPLLGAKPLQTPQLLRALRRGDRDDEH